MKMRKYWKFGKHWFTMVDVMVRVEKQNKVYFENLQMEEQR